MPPSPVSKLDLRHTGRLRKGDNLLTERGEGVEEEPNYTTAWSTINHSILSGLENLRYFIVCDMEKERAKKRYILESALTTLSIVVLYCWNEMLLGGSLESRMC